MTKKTSLDLVKTLASVSKLVKEGEMRLSTLSEQSLQEQKAVAVSIIRRLEELKQRLSQTRQNALRLLGLVLLISEGRSVSETIIKATTFTGFHLNMRVRLNEDDSEVTFVSSKWGGGVNKAHNLVSDMVEDEFDGLLSQLHQEISEKPLNQSAKVLMKKIAATEEMVHAAARIIMSFRLNEEQETDFQI